MSGGLLAAVVRLGPPIVVLLAGTACSLPRGTSLLPAPVQDLPIQNPGHPAWFEPAPGAFRVRFETTQGVFVIEVVRDWALRGADRLYHLVRAGFFDDSRFFRVRAGFIAQFGIPGDPAIAGVWRDRAMPDDSATQSNQRGFMAYAMTGPNTRTTQLFINLADNQRLDAENFAPIGRVIEGMDVVDRLYAGYDEASGGGMRLGRQGRLFTEGNAYLDREFPRLGRLIRATVLPIR
ncbi:MAG TPA: peptidylprolyl isomerase [Gemmatimonadales bacterium]